MSVWGGLIARDVTEMATDGDAEDVAELAEVIGPMLDRYGLAMPSADATLLEAARRYWVPCPVSCRGAVVDLVDTCGVSVGGSGLVIVDDGPALSDGQRRAMKRLLKMTPRGTRIPWVEAWRHASPDSGRIPGRITRITRALHQAAADL